MATMYARSTLTTWDNSTVGGWSNTSGGASNGTVPDGTTDVIFDSSSGTARTITIGGSANCATLNTTGSNGMTFSSAVNPVTVNGNVNLTSTVQMSILTTGGPCALTSGGTPISSLNVAGLMTLQDNLTVTGAVTSTSLNGSIDANNKNLTAASVSSTSGSPTFTMGSGTWQLTGTGSVWDSGSATITPNTSTIKLTDNSSSAKTFVGRGDTYNNFWNATQGTGTVTITGANTFNNVKVDAGRTQIFPSGNTNTVTSFTADGTGGTVTIKSDSLGTAATLAKSGGGSIYLDYCSIRDITATPSSTWNARNSTNVSGNTGINFIPGNSKFFQFL